MSNAPQKPVTIEPFKRGNDFLIGSFWDERGLNITDRDYHSHRNAIMNMRKNDPQTAKLHDKFLDEVVTKRGSLPEGEMKALQEGLAKNKVTIEPISNEIARDLKKHGYSSSYRPEIMLSVNGRPMLPQTVIAELKDAGVQGTFETQRSQAPGSISGKPISYQVSEAAKLLPKETPRYGGSGDTMGSKLMKEELVHQSSRFGSVRSGLGGGLMKVGAGVATGLVAGVAAAAEPDATPKSVALAAGDEAIPGFRAARQPDATIAKTALAVGDDVVPGFKLGRQGQMCKAFGEVAGVTLAGGTVAVGATLTTATAAAASPTVVGAVAIAAGGAAVTTAAAKQAHESGSIVGEEACNAVATGYNKVKSALGFGGP